MKQPLMYIRTDKNGTKYYSDCTCKRCGGGGYIDAYKYNDGGVCFGCFGSGVSEKPSVVKEYTPEYKAKLDTKRAIKLEALEKERQELEAKRELERQQRELEKQRKKQEALEPFKNSEFVGEENQRLEFKLTCNKSIQIQAPFTYGQYDDGIRYLNMLFDSNNNVYMWKSTKSLKPGESYAVKATVKSHTVYSDIKQTNLTRLTVISTMEGNANANS